MSDHPPSRRTAIVKKTPTTPAPPAPPPDELDPQAARLRTAAMAGAAAVGLMAVFGALTSPHGIWPLLPVRIATVALLGAAGALATSPWGRRHGQLLGILPLLALAGQIAVVIHYEGGAQSPFFATMCLLIVVGPLVLGIEPGGVALIGAAILAIYAAPIRLAGKIVDLRLFATHCAIIAASAAVAFFIARLFRQLERREAAARADLLAANERLRALDRAKTEFYENVAHELRTPLTLNLSPLEALVRGDAGPLSDEQRRLIEVVRSNAFELRALVNKLLDLGRLDAKRSAPHPIPLRLAASIEAIAARFTEAFRGKGLALEVDPGPADLVVLLDPEGLVKTVSNLLANALRYTDVGKARLAVRVDGEELELAVADTGIGIPADALPLLFERFRRAGGHGATREGTGLGLALVKALVEAEGGRIACESEVGKGTTMRVRLPLRRAPEDGAIVVEPGMAALGGEAAPPAAEETAGLAARARVADVGAGEHRVLIVEDNAQLADFLVGLLSRRYRVRAAADGVEGLELARRAAPDVIVADVGMPRMSGLELCRALQADEALAPVPVLLLTARADAEHQVEGYGAGAVDYLAKPFDPHVLDAKITALIHIRDLNARLVARERLAAVGEVTVTLAHEINNALSGIAGSAELLEHAAGLAGDERELVHAIRQGARRIAETVTRLRELRDAKPVTYVRETKMIALD
jgi:signal transduction histidine kinase